MNQARRSGVQIETTAKCKYVISFTERPSFEEFSVSQLGNSRPRVLDPENHGKTHIHKQCESVVTPQVNHNILKTLK